MKRTITILLALAMLVSLLCTAAFASAEPSEEAPEEAVEEVAEEAAIDMDPFYGEWIAFAGLGEEDLQLNAKVILLPDGTLTIGYGYEPVIRWERIDDTHISISLEDYTDLEMEATAEYFIITPELEEEYKDATFFSHLMSEDIYLDYDAPLFILTVTLPDDSNPLATYSLSGQTAFCKNLYQDEFLEILMTGNTWLIGDKTLVIDEDGDLDLNDGASTGDAFWYSTSGEDAPAYVSFSWNGGDTVEYTPTAIDETSITLVNTENPDDILVLTLADAESEATEEPAA